MIYNQLRIKKTKNRIKINNQLRIKKTKNRIKINNQLRIKLIRKLKMNCLKMINKRIHHKQKYRYMKELKEFGKMNNQNK